MQRSLLRCALVVLGLGACAAPKLPPDARLGLSPSWVDAGGQYRYPPENGFAGPPVPMVLPPGMLIDRFGSANGTFFSPRGAGYAARSLPQSCALRPYAIYRIKQPLLAWIGKAAPWFGEAGGATQIETDAPASALVRDEVIEVASLPRLPCP